MIERYLLYYILTKVYKESVKHKKALPIFSKNLLNNEMILLLKDRHSES